MARLAMNELTTLRWSFDEDVENFKAAGYDAIGVWRHKLADFGEEKGIDLLTEQKLPVSSLHWAGGFTGSDGRSHGDAIEDAREAIRLAASMRAGCLVVHSGSRALHTLNHARRLLRHAIDELLPLAEALRVTLALEPMHSACGADWTFLACLEEAERLIASYRSPRLKLVLDTFEWGQEESLLARLDELAPNLALVQLADGRCSHAELTRVPLGQGCIPLRQLIERLEAAGCDAPFEIELMGEELEGADYAQLLRETRETFRSWNEPAPATARQLVPATQHA